MSSENCVPASEGYMTPKQAAGFLNVSERSLEAMRRRGDVPTYHKVGRLVRYAPSDLREWMQNHRVSSTSQAPGRAA